MGAILVLTHTYNQCSTVLDSLLGWWENLTGLTVGKLGEAYD